MGNVIVTGANRGLGLEFTRQCLHRGDTVFAGCRVPREADQLNDLHTDYPDHLSVQQLDLTDEERIHDFAASVAGSAEEVDLLINNAAVGPRGETPRHLEAETMLHTFHVNTVGPSIVIREHLDLLEQADRPRILNLSSELASLNQALSNNRYSYSSSKVALNMITRMLAKDLREAGIIVVAVHPGWVQTRMGGRDAPLSPETSVKEILLNSERLTQGDSGQFFTWDGRKHQW